MTDKLPPPECPFGYPYSQLEEILDKQELARLQLWMYGQTCMLCEGRAYSHETKEYAPDACANNPHGVVVYKHDIERWMRAGQIID